MGAEWDEIQPKRPDMLKYVQELLDNTCTKFGMLDKIDVF